MVRQTEEQLYELLAAYIRRRYPDIPFHFDLSGMWTPSHRLRNMYGRLNKRGFPDLFIAVPSMYEGEHFHGLFLELKREGERLSKKNGDYSSEHVAEQADWLAVLAAQGYLAAFACGFIEAQTIIDSYMEFAV